MPTSQCPSTPHNSRTASLLNVSTEGVLQNRWTDSSQEERKRLEKCWGYMDCGDCHRSDGFCGWCALSNTCLPLPNTRFSRTLPLLSPLTHPNICAMGSERFELRTTGLGCQVSTITFLTALVTIFCTVFGVLVLVWGARLLRWGWTGVKGLKGGWEVRGDGGEGVWVRKGEGWGEWWRGVKVKVRGEEDELAVDGGLGERARWWWKNKVRGGRCWDRRD
ncbi:uncharacterized protein EI97DRAFT_494046 [Westerdykella ornata]|uniref:PSI domain-containing protein n=1 Tax=Westerdykella ornata TaxID=318751 RepID=A0A6A6JNH6_WESOR|nr:uncharacterized protein EI97DRAFT_494046 [Westerdykella ornata]KAF2276469.1 hypothetical protein EI97DRAFT_494046 [Westerdykella ornata]